MSMSSVDFNEHSFFKVKITNIVYVRLAVNSSNIGWIKCVTWLLNAYIIKINHCMKSVQIRTHFRSVFSCIRNEYRNTRTRNNFVFRQFSRSKPMHFVKYVLIQSFF